MTTRNVLSALIGLFFILAPWLIGFSDNGNAVRTSLIMGIVLASASVLAIGQAGWNSWQLWTSFIAGIGFIMFPFIYGFSWMLAGLYVILGLIVVFLNFYNMDADAP